MNNLDVLPTSGKGISYVNSVIQTYVTVNQVDDLNNREATQYVARDIMAGLGVFEDSLVYKEAIIRKLSWIVIRITVSNVVNKMFPGRDPHWIEGVINTCMDNGSSDWYREGVMKLGVAKIVETFGIR